MDAAVPWPLKINVEKVTVNYIPNKEVLYILNK